MGGIGVRIGQAGRALAAWFVRLAGSPAPQASSSAPSAELDRMAAWIVAAVLLGQWFYLARAPVARLGLYVNDDAYYYLMVARNWASHGFPSFDGTEPTNGFQALWQLLLVPLVLAGGKALQLRLTLMLCSLLFQAGLLFLSRSLRHLAGPRAGLGFVLVAEGQVFLVWTFALDGMEAALEVALVGAIALVLARGWSADRPLPVVSLGVLTGLLGVTRLDGLALIPGLAAVLWLRDRRARPVLHFLAIAFAPAVAFLAAGALLTGAPLPVSSQVKIVWNEHAVAAAGGGFLAHLRLAAENLARLGFRMASRALGGYAYFAARLLGLAPRAVSFGGGIVGALVVALGVARAARGRLPSRAVLLLPFVAMSAIRVTFFAWFYPATFADYDWYYAVEVLELLVLLALLVPRRAFGRAALAAVAVLFAVDLAGFLRNAENRAHAFPVEQAVAFLDHAGLGRGEAVGSWDAGYAAFLLDRPVANLDGLVSSRAFFDRVLGGRVALRSYLEDRGIRYLVNPVGGMRGDLENGFRGLRPGEYRVVYLSPTYHGPFGDEQRCAVLELTPAPVR